jgi:hypothetical protein
MFSVLVRSDDKAWETDQLMRWTWADRFNTHSGNEGVGISPKNPATLKALENTTALLMYEDIPSSPHANVVRIGRLKDISSSGYEVSFRFVEQGRLPRAVVKEFTSRLGMSKFDHNHTHWAIKDFDIPSDLLKRVIPTPESYDLILRTPVLKRLTQAEVNWLLVFCLAARTVDGSFNIDTELPTVPGRSRADVRHSMEALAGMGVVFGGTLIRIHGEKVTVRQEAFLAVDAYGAVISTGTEFHKLTVEQALSHKLKSRRDSGAGDRSPNAAPFQ